MLFNIDIYNQWVLIVTFLIVGGFLIFIFKSKYISIIDPLTLHLVWLASHFSFLGAYIYKYGCSALPLFFILNLIIYIIAYWFFLKKKNSFSAIKNKTEIKSKQTRYIFFFLVTLNLLSKYDFYLFVMSNPSIGSWVQYRFILMQGQNPLARILSTATEIYITYYAFILFAILKKWRPFVLTLYMLILLLDVFAGGRSIMLNVIFNIGLCIFYFKDQFNVSAIKKFTKRAVIVAGIAIVTAILITSFYNSNNTFFDGITIMTNRFFAAGDGLEYYMKYNGLTKIHSGIEPYIYSVFGIYLKHFTGVTYDNIGFQLAQIVLGDLAFTQGANYTFLLQVMVLGYSWFWIYVPIVAFITAKLRSLKFKNNNLLPLSFFFSATSFYIALDIEFWILNVVSGVLFFFIAIYPLSNFSFRLK